MIATFDPTLEQIRRAAAALRGSIVRTPCVEQTHPGFAQLLGRTARLHLKLELFQVTGSFKPRGALTVMRSLGDDALRRGVTAISAGNHAIAVAYAARALGTSAKVVMYDTADPLRVALARQFGAEVLLTAPGQGAFDLAAQIAHDENRTLIHPFEHPGTVCGTATIGLEILSDIPELDAMIVPIGGGGLAAGIASAIKQVRPACLVLGVEPEGAAAMTASFAAGSAQRLASTATIADSLAPPFVGEGCFALCQHYLDDLVTVPDAAIAAAMATLFHDSKVAAEPAGATALAALMGPYRARLEGKSVTAIVCGGNFAAERFAAVTKAGAI